MDKRIVVPEGMLEVARKAADTAFDEGRIVNCRSNDDPTAFANTARICLEAALKWLSENPIVPSTDQTGSLVDWYNHKKFGNGAVCDCAVEWQRRMFLAPEPVVPEEVKDLLWQTEDVAPDTHNEQVIEAFNRGKRSKA